MTPFINQRAERLGMAIALVAVLILVALSR